MAIRRVALLGAVLAAVLLAHPASCDSDSNDDSDSDSPEDWAANSSPPTASPTTADPPFVCSKDVDLVRGDNCETGLCSNCNSGGMCAACKGLENVFALCAPCANCVLCAMCTSADCVDPVPQCVWDGCDAATGKVPTTCPEVETQITTGCLANCTNVEKEKLRKFFEVYMPEHDDLSTCHALWYEGAD